jgi:hypothetical protein
VGLNADDNFLLRVPSAQQAESYIVKLGAAGINANVIVSQARTIDEADKEIKDNNIKGIIFEPTLTIQRDHQYIDVLNNLIPELASTGNGSRVKSAKYPSLTALIQTNFYSYPGVFKFRVMNMIFRAFLTTLMTNTSNFPKTLSMRP